ncbi:MAG: hypothetical protein FWG87_08555 [Defluviitaleaceae bacterium]|nr:hypothetical protein [Defluviitaleaceae bacterium]
MKKHLTHDPILLTLFLLLALLLLSPLTLQASNPNQPNPANERPTQQRPISESSITVEPQSSGGSSYNLNIMWSRPLLSTVEDMRVPSDRLYDAANLGMWTNFPTHYNLRFRNATRNENFNSDPNLPPRQINAPADGQVRIMPPSTRLEVSTGPRTYTMRHSSLYEVAIDPIRPIPVMVPSTNPSSPEPYISSIDAPIDNSPGLAPARDLLFLTDIEVAADGRNNTFTITWEDPSWGGTNVFTHWQISRAIYPIPPGETVWHTYPVIPVDGVALNSGTIVRNPNGTLTATIVDMQLRPIGQYAVRVEPMLGANPSVTSHTVRRNLDGSQKEAAEITINGRNFNLHFTQNDYTAVVTMIPQLNIEQAGVEFLRLWWPHLTAIENEITWIEIEEWPPEMEGQIPQANTGRVASIATFSGTAFLYNTDVFVGPGIPSERRGFALAIRLNNGTVIRTEIVVFDPLVAEFSPYRPEIFSIDHVGGGVLGMEWFAFTRHPAVPGEMSLIPQGDPYIGRFVDTAVQYEIFISDDWQSMEIMNTPLMTILPRDLQWGERMSRVQPDPPTTMYDPTWSLYPVNHITQYQALTPQGVEIRPISGNSVYFVKIRAVREPGGQASSWAYGSVYVPPLEQLAVTPEMISAPPVRIVQAGAKETEMALEWDIRYLEILQPNPTEEQREQFRKEYPHRDVWHTVVGASRPAANGLSRLIFGRSAAHINYLRDDLAEAGAAARHGFLNDIIGQELRAELLGQQEFPINVNNPRELSEFLTNSRARIDAFLAQWGYVQTPDGPPLALRVQNTEAFSYQIHVAPYDVVQRHPSGFIGYRDTISTWTDIGEPTVRNGVASYTVTGLDENTAYVVFVRPYLMVNGQRVTAAYPTFVTGTTVVTPDRPVPDPTTPVLHPVPRYTTRNRVAVRWRVMSDMTYQLRISHFSTDYPAGGTVINLTHQQLQQALAGDSVELDEPRAILDVEDVDGFAYFHLRISERFPATTYYIWATATGVDQDGNSVTAPSLPSNPVDIRTLDIEPPPPPRSLARAPQNLLDMYNRYNSTDHRNDEPDTLMISFMRIFADLRDDMGRLTERAESGAAEGGNAEPLNMPNLSQTEAYAAIHIIRFADLDANRHFYVRGRTVLTVTRGEADKYSYEIEISENEDFLDYTKFTIPPLPADDPINTRRAVSEWVNIELDTGFGDGEFDGAHRPDQYPLPENDYETTYDPATQTLTWRFRTDQRGADGRLDQNTDQRFITRLIQSRVFTYTIDLSSFGASPVANREVILPESILRAFTERKISLEILAGDMNFVIPPGAFDTAQLRALQTGIGTYYHITLNAVQSGMPPLVTNTEFATLPLRFGVSARTPSRTESLAAFAVPIRAVLPVGERMSPDGLRTGLYIADTATAAWRDTQGEFSFANNTLSAGFQVPATVAGITRNAPSQANDTMARVSSQLTITDMTSFDPNRIVTADEFNNIVYALVTNSSTVTLGGSLTPAEARSLSAARLLAPQNLTREAALDIMVRLYENRTKQVLTPMTDASSIAGLQNAGAAYQRNIRLAADLGMLTGPLEPLGRVGMGEVIGMVDIVVGDSVGV